MTRKTLFAFILAALVAAPSFAGDWTAVGTVVSIRGEITTSGVSLTEIVINDGAGTGQYSIECPPANVLPNACHEVDAGSTYAFEGRVRPKADGSVALVLDIATPTVNTVPIP